MDEKCYMDLMKPESFKIKKEMTPNELFTKNS